MAPLTGAGLEAMAGIGAVAAISVFQSVAYYQNANIGLVWMNRFVDLNLLGSHPGRLVQFDRSDGQRDRRAAADRVVALAGAARRRAGDLGNTLSVPGWRFANLLLVAASAAGGSVSALVPMSYDILLGLAFIYYWPTLLALVSRAAPLSMKATLMGAIFLSLFVSNFFIGWLGRFYETLGPAGFWTLHAGIAAAGGLLAMLLKRPLTRLLGTAET